MAAVLFKNSTAATGIKIKESPQSASLFSPNPFIGLADCVNYCSHLLFLIGK